MMPPMIMSFENWAGNEDDSLRAWRRDFLAQRCLTQSDEEQQTRVNTTTEFVVQMDLQNHGEW